MKLTYPGIAIQQHTTVLSRFWKSISWVQVALWLCALVMAACCGLFIATGWYILVAGLIGLPLGLLLFKWPEKSLAITLVCVLVIPGIIELYLPQFMLIRWLFPILASATSFTILFSYLWGGQQQNFGHFGYKAMMLTILFLVVSIFSSVLGNGFSANAIVGLKGYFQLWPVLLGFIFLKVDKQKLTVLISRAVIWVGLLQIPFALHQFLILVPMRMTTKLAEETVVAIDVVAGTFGATMWGGGRSTILGVFQMIAIALVIMQYRNHLLSLRKAIVICGLLLIPVLISEIKAFPFFMLLSALVIFRDMLIKHPFKFISYGLMMMAFCASLFVVNFFLPAAEGQQASTLDRYIEEAISYNVGDKGYGNSTLNRSSVYSFWAGENISKGDVVHLLVGYGPGATNAFTTMETSSVAAKLYSGYAIGLTALSALLWDCGIIGALVFIGIIFYAVRAALVVINRPVSALENSLLTTMIVTMALISLTLLHVNYLVFDLGYQTLFIVALGYIVLMEKADAET